MGTDVELPAARPARTAGGFAAVAIGLLAILLAVGTVWTVPRPTGDLYVALAAGRDILNGKLGALDDWSFSTGGRVWVNQNWGTHLLYYLFYRAFGGGDGGPAGVRPDGQDPGETGLLLLKLLLLLTGATFLTLACHRRGAGWAVALVVAAGVMAAGRSFIDLRPNLTTLMFVPVMLHLLYRTSDKASRSWVVMIVFGLIWANLHGGFFLGLAFFGWWSLCTVVPEVLRERLIRKHLLGFVWAVAAGAIAWAFAAEGGWPKARIPAAGIAFVAILVIHVVLMYRHDLAPGKRREVNGQYRAELGRSLGPRWHFLAATAGAFVLAGVVTPFGVHQLFRDYSSLKMPFWEIWNLSHPFVVMASRDSDLWQRVIEWHSIFSAEVSTFGTSWEFFGIVGLFSVLVPLHVSVKVARRRPVTPEDLVLLVFIVVLTVAIFARALPTWADFRPIVEQVRRGAPGSRQLGEVLQQRWGWFAAMIVFPLLGVLTIAVCVLVVRDLVVRRATIERWSLGQIGRLVFDVTVTAGGIYLAFGARRFIPLSLLLLAPLLAVRLQWLLATAGAGLAWLAYHTRAPSSRAAGAAGPVPAPSALRALPTMVVGVAVLATIAFQTHSNVLRYLPNNPTVRYKSMLRNMIVYSMFPPNCRDFLNDNELGGRVFNEWRWEGYLRWYCPQVKLFLGGRAQQVYDVETYKRQQRLLSGDEPPSTLGDEGVRWVVVPLNVGYNRLMRDAVYVEGAFWVPVFTDGENIVLANSKLPECQKVINACLAGRLTFREPAFAALSRGYCISSRAIGDARVAAAKPKTEKEEELIRRGVMRGAIEAVKESHKYRPIYTAYQILGSFYRQAPPQADVDIPHFEKVYQRLSGMDYHHLSGMEILHCRRWVASMLAAMYRANKQMDKYAWAAAEAQRVDGLIEATNEKWQ